MIENKVNSPSRKQLELIYLYKLMVQDGYERIEGYHISKVFSDMEIHAFKKHIKILFDNFKVKTLLDYGCGGSDYEEAGFSLQKSAREYFELTEIYLYEPARDIDQRCKVDAVVCFDVLEHIYISDIPRVIRELFSLSEKILVINVACYPAAALLPNGENAHITVRPPLWWKGVIDSIAVEYPNVSVQLWCSTAWRKVEAYKLLKSSDWQERDGFVVSL